jgi:CheY-like chemotaxis protein
MTNQRHNQTILVADDEPEIVDLVRMFLEWEGYAVAEASDGEQALAQAQAIVPDLIFLDVRMPKMNGLDVLERLQADPALAGIPVVMLSVVTTNHRVQTALEKGAVAFLPKPFELPEMRQDGRRSNNGHSGGWKQKSERVSTHASPSAHH